MQSNPGVYALLLGSGVSRAAEVPTGWEVVQDLIRKVAILENEKPGPTPEEWFSNKYGREPTYSGLLESVAKTQAERSKLLSAYFEPTESGERLPTEGHHAIARLVKGGYVRVILTTNFDRLIEQSLESAGVHPTVICSPDDVEGASPLIHNDCTVIKLHGDYLDLRTRNTPAELDEYDDRINDMLDRIYDEFGVVICGWSGDWDTALCAAIMRAKGRRYSTYWAVRGSLGDQAKRIVGGRSAVTLDISDADRFFSDLYDKVDSIETMAMPHPLSPRIAIAQTKKYIEENKPIRLHDLLMNEVEGVVENVRSDRFPVQGRPAPEELVRRIQAYEAASSIALSIAATGGYWGKQPEISLWVRAIERITNREIEKSGLTDLVNLQHYPAVLFHYAVGMGAAAAGKYDTLFAVTRTPQINDEDDTKMLSYRLHRKLSHQLFKAIPGLSKRKLASNERIYAALREPMRDLIPGDREYEEAFDIYETLQSMESAYLHGYAIPGTFMYRYYVIRSGEKIPLRDGSPLLAMNENVKQHGGNAKVLKAGYLGGSIENWKMAEKIVDEMSDDIG